MHFPGFAEMFVIFMQFTLGLSGGQMPVGMPPQPEMPVMSQVAPDECVLYMSFAGAAKPDANSTNQTERFLAEPQVQALVKSIDSAIQQGLDKSRRPEVPQAGYTLVKQLLSQPWCVFVSDCTISPKTPPTGHAGAMICLGDKKAAFEASLKTILNEARVLEKIETVTIDGKTFNRLPIMKDESLTWGIIPWKDGKAMFVVGFGKGTVESMLQRAKTPAPAWLVKIKEQLPVQRRATLSYINLKAVKKIVVPLIAKENHMPPEQVDMILDAFGVGNLKSLQATTGLDETGMVDRIRLEADGPLEGMVAALVGSSLTPQDLAVVPADANLLLAVKLDPSKLYKSIRTAISTVEPRAGMQLEVQARRMANAAGMESFKELLGSVGNTWVIYNSPSEGGTLPTGLTLSVEVNDSFTKTRAALENLIEMIGKNDRYAPKLKKKQYKGVQISYLTFRDPVPFAPSWCVKDGRLFVSLVSQNLCAMLDRKVGAKRSSIAGVPEVAAALAHYGEPAPTALFYTDPKPIVQMLYPVLPYLANSATSMFRRHEKIDIDAFTIPSLPTILPYAKPTIHTLRRTGSGIELESHSVLPGISASSGTLPVITGMLFPAAMAARGSARRMHSANNMRQVNIALMMYENTYGSYPPAYSVDKNGKPLLSWRVHILPFIEECTLYEQFHLDEPWDSPHNKKLIAQMPFAYKSPQSNAGPGKTTYLTVRTDKSIFPGKDKIKIRDITDGTSNTIAVLEVNDAKAVTWTKPDDFVPDAKNPMKGLKGVYRDVFQAGFADGSVQSLSIRMSKDMLRAYFTRNGGEIIEEERTR